MYSVFLLINFLALGQTLLQPLRSHHLNIRDTLRRPTAPLSTATRKLCDVSELGKGAAHEQHVCVAKQCALLMAWHFATRHMECFALAMSLRFISGGLAHMYVPPLNLSRRQRKLLSTLIASNHVGQPCAPVNSLQPQGADDRLEQHRLKQHRHRMQDVHAASLQNRLLNKQSTDEVAADTADSKSSAAVL